MLLYNVTIKIDTEIADEWSAWMKNSHIPDVLATGLFTDSRLCRILGDDNPDGITFAAQYHCPSVEHFQRYQKEFAPALQAQTQQKYGGRFAAFRTVMEIL